MMGFNFDIITVVHQASITEWIQALAALIAVPGAIAGFWVLFRRDKEKVEMIIQLKVQTEQLAAQTGELNAQVFQLGKIHQVLSEGIAAMTKNVQMAEQNRRNDLRPYLVVATIKPAEYKSGAQYEFFNKGGSAEDVCIQNFKGEGTQYLAQSRAERGQSIIIVLYQSTPFLQEWSFELHYTDSDGIPYKQILTRKKEHAFEPLVSPPIRRDENAPTKATAP